MPFVAKNALSGIQNGSIIVKNLHEWLFGLAETKYTLILHGGSNYASLLSVQYILFLQEAIGKRIFL